jgi:hypothetical protein
MRVAPRVILPFKKLLFRRVTRHGPLVQICPIVALPSLENHKDPQGPVAMLPSRASIR